MGVGWRQALSRSSEDFPFQNLEAVVLLATVAVILICGVA